MEYFNLHTNNQSHRSFSKPRPPNITNPVFKCPRLWGIFLIQNTTDLLFLNVPHIAASQKLSAIETEVCSRKEGLTRLKLKFKKLKQHVAIVNWAINEIYTKKVIKTMCVDMILGERTLST